MEELDFQSFKKHLEALILTMEELDFQSFKKHLEASNFCFLCLEGFGGDHFNTSAYLVKDLHDANLLNIEKFQRNGNPEFKVWEVYLWADKILYTDEARKNQAKTPYLRPDEIWGTKFLDIDDFKKISSHFYSNLFPITPHFEGECKIHGHWIDSLISSCPHCREIIMIGRDQQIMEDLGLMNNKE